MKATRPDTRPRSPARGVEGPGGASRAAAAVSVLLLAAALCVTGCRSETRPDVLLVTIDTLRADHCSAYGYEIETTPVLEQMAAGGILFENAYSESSTTAPSHATLLTGRHFRTLGVTKNASPLSSEAVTLAERLRDEGYATAAFVSSFPLMTRFGFAQGFEVYDDSFVNEEASIGRQKGEKAHDRQAGYTIAHLERWLAAFHDPRPLFLWVHFVDPHSPYKAPEAFHAKWPDDVAPVIPRYDGEVRYADKQLGRLFALLDARRKDRIDVVTSDHGEGLGDHGWMSHGINLHEESVRVPLVARWPGHLEAGRRVKAPVGIVDVAPGILDLLGLELETFEHGVSLFGKEDAARSIYLQRRDYKSAREGGQKISKDMTAVVHGGMKLIVSSGAKGLAPGELARELYDLGEDPREMRDLLGGAAKASRRQRAKGQAPPEPSPIAPEQKAEAERKAGSLAGTLDAWREAHPPAMRSEEPMDKETLRALRSLGYVD